MNGREILLVEDDVTLISSLVSELSGLGFVVYQARDGESAKRMLKKNKGIRAILSDLCLPDMTGLELMASLEDSVKYCRPPFLLMTGYANELDEKKAHCLGARSLLVKPFSIDLLFSSLMMALEDSQQKAA